MNNKAIAKLIHELKNLDKEIYLTEGDDNEIELEFDEYIFFFKLSVKVKWNHCQGDRLTPPSTDFDNIEADVIGLINCYTEEDGDFLLETTPAQDREIINLILNKVEL